MEIKMIKRLVITLLSVLAISNVQASESATPQEVYEMVLKGANVLETLGADGLAAFNDPKGEFTWKDTYVQVYNCNIRRVVGHPNTKLLEMKSEEWWSVKDKKGNYLTRRLCEASKNPNGAWIEYWWPKMGETEASRKVTFIIQVPGTPYQVSAGIYDDKLSIEQLSKIK